MSKGQPIRKQVWDDKINSVWHCMSPYQGYGVVSPEVQKVVGVPYTEIRMDIEIRMGIRDGKR